MHAFAPAKSADEFRTAEAAKLRAARKAVAVVHVEGNNGAWAEFDIRGEQHGRALADEWVDGGHARGVSCWHVRAKGKLARRAFYLKFWTPPDD